MIDKSILLAAALVGAASNMYLEPFKNEKNKNISTQNKDSSDTSKMLDDDDEEAKKDGSERD